MEEIAVIELCQGKVGFYDPLSRVYLSLMHTQEKVYSYMNISGLQRAIKNGTIRIVSGSLTPEMVPGFMDDIEQRKAELAKKKAEEAKKLAEETEKAEIEKSEEEAKNAVETIVNKEKTENDKEIKSKTKKK